MSVPIRWTPDRAGCIFAGSSNLFVVSSNRTADELNAAVVLLALQEGWSLDSGQFTKELREMAETTHTWLDDADDTQWLSDSAQAATDWLNEHIAPEDFSFEFDDEFRLVHYLDSDELVERANG